LNIILIGTESTSSEIALSATGLKQGSNEKIRIFADDVGNLKSIKLINKGRSSYLCSSIRIESEMNYWNFECEKAIKCPQRCVMELNVVNLLTYDITVKTSTIENSGTSLPIYVVIWGSNGKTPKKLLADKGFQTGSLVQVSLQTLDVGNPHGITFYLNGNDLWRPEEIIIKKINSTGESEEKNFKNVDNRILSSMDKSLTLKLPKLGDNDSDDSSNSNSSSLLDTRDLEKVIKLSCTDVLKDNENFGPTYVTDNVNYMMFFAECPSDCMRVQMRAVGMGIHPEESPICINALVDRAISFYGGIITVNIFKGLPTYTGGIKMFNIPIQGYGPSKRSYSIAKIDNIDMIANDVRIIDSEGRTTYRGRLEIRSQGVWGTICAASLDNSAAKIICKQIGYKEGKFLNPHENKGRGFCSNYEGVNYCGVEAAPIIFSHLNCQGNEESIMDCYRKIADKSFCTHQYDTLIECGNTDEEQIVTSFEANTLRLIDSTNNPTQTGIGRLEILKGNWGSICNTKFSDKAAQVSCKQMGYLDGKLYGQPDSNTMCINVLGNNLCGDYSLPIKLTDVNCNGHEKSIKDCKSNDNTVSCNLFNNVVLKCEGYGDASGRSQNIRKPKVLNPLIEKLPMSPTFNAKCDSTAKSMQFRGDPGSIYQINCPSDCATKNYSVTGTGVYSIDSSICRAALQSGIITNDGGNLALIKTYGQNRFYGSTLRGVSSLESNYLKVSFFLTATTSSYSKMTSMLNNSFLELGFEEKFYPALGNNHMFSSFIETQSGGTDSKANFEWVSPNNDYKFDGSSTFIDLYEIDAAKKILEMKTFSIYSKIRMGTSKGKSQNIFSIGGCEGFSIIIDVNSELIFDVKCGTLSYKSGIYIPVNYDSQIGIVYDGSKVNYYLNGNKYNEVNTYFNLHYKPKITIGRNSEFSADFFNGKIFYIAFFSEALGPIRINKIYRDGYLKPDKVRVPKQITLDNRECISSCANQPIPGMPGSPKPPPEAITYEINGDKTILSGSIAGSRTSSGDKNELNPFIEVKCTSTAREIFKGDIKVGDKVRIKCPSNCKNGLIYGTLIYSFDSVACMAAIHTGIVKPNVASMVLLKALPGLSFYQGTNQYGVQSTSIDKSDYSFQVEEAPPVITVNCKTTASTPQFAGTLGMKFLVRCPDSCSKTSHYVFGNNLYSGDSSICQAAIHAGALNDRGGEVQFMIEPGQKLYFRKRAFGIESKERDSYVKSIRFFNANNNLFVKYKEEFKSQSVQTNWDVNDNLEANNYPSKWEFVKTPANIKASSNFLLHQAHKTKSESTLSYGTILTLKNVDVVNSYYKLSFYFLNLSPVGIIFRYKDENNYYHLRINNSGAFKLILVKRFEGKSVCLATSQISINPKMWYTFTMLIYYDSFQIFLQIGDLRNNQLIFDIQDNDIQRGSLGIGSDGNDDFYVNGIYVDNYEMNKSHLTTKAAADTRSFELILRENNENHRSKYCKSLFDHKKDKIMECKEFHRYCEYRCNEMIHKRENILNFSCKRSCIKDSLMKQKLDNMQMIEEVAYGINPSIWSPKDGEKGDFKPDDLGPNSQWVPCYISEVKSNANDPEQKFVTLKYMIEGKVKNKTVLYPSISLKKCGEMLQNRKDCNSKNIQLPNIKDSN
jgi:hypothetical protein